MADNTKIQWADATLNPVTGCQKVSRGCDFCYAERLVDTRQVVNPLSPRFGHPFEEVMLHPERIDTPLHWKRPRRIFVNSLSDMWHVDIPDAFIDSVFDMMEKADWHIFQILTKRSERMRRYINKRYSGRLSPPHLHIGVSVEDGDAGWRVRDLQRAKVGMAWISAEPVLGSLRTVSLTGMGWVVLGGESGPGARPMHPQWARDMRDRCIAAGVPFFYKQTGAWEPRAWYGDGATHAIAFDGEVVEFGRHLSSGDHPFTAKGNEGWWQAMARVGKRSAGRLLDGREWNEFPLNPLVVA